MIGSDQKYKAVKFEQLKPENKKEIIFYTIV